MLAARLERLLQIWIFSVSMFHNPSGYLAESVGQFSDQMFPAANRCNVLESPLDS